MFIKIKIFVYQYFISAIFSLLYPIKRKKLNFSIMNSVDTIDYIIKNKVSVSRYGDGEYDLIGRRGNGFQQDNADLSAKLAYILENPIPKHLICIPFALRSVSGLRVRSKLFWMSFVVRRNELISKNTRKDIFYGNSLFSRFYIIMGNRKKSPIIADSIKEIWKGRNVCIVEGEFTKLGVGNDLLDGANDVKRILCPAQNAFDKYEKIREVINANVSKDTLILCALGMTATALTYDLTIDGYQAIDIGHVDVEYMWMKMKAKSQCPIQGKYVNEISDKEPIKDIWNISKQILYKV